jgi:D-beta-D-heptose 7-phosphate kinase/D-beta-D-heptose 1-phosphate adenosyltransferase
MKNTEKSSKIVKNILSGGIKLTDRFISDKADLSAVVKTLKQAGYRIVLTQGVYDMFHVGHKRYLESAKSHGDILIVGIDSDELTRKMKGPKRPFDKLEDRLEILAGLKVVDIVTVRHVDEPMYGLIKLVRPDVLVMSQTTSTFSDKDKKNLLPYCGTIQTLPAQASTTTTAKLQRIMIDGAEELGSRISLLINDFLGSIQSNESSRSIYTSHPQRNSRPVRKTKAGSSLHTRTKLKK